VILPEDNSKDIKDQQSNVSHVHSTILLKSNASVDHKPEVKTVDPLTTTDVFELTSFQNVPSYLHYPYVLNGYRTNFSYKLCLKSIFKTHNETGNIWTHLMATVCFLGITIHTFTHILKPDDPFQDKMFFFVFLMGALVNFITSVCFHTFNCHSLDTCKLVAGMDFGGISNHICCSWILLANYLFHDNFPLQCVYIAVISCHSIFMLLSPKIVSESHAARIIVFGLMAVFGILPIIHWMFLNGLSSPVVMEFGWRFPACWVIYAIGLIAFVYKVPERFAPGKFDYMINSHQIWHCFVWFGNAWFHWIVASLALYHQQVHH